MVKHLNEEEFKKLVFNYEENGEWKYLGDKPCIIDFYAEWCAPCRMISPILEDIAKQYEGKLYVYKVDTDKEIKLSQLFGIRSIPTILFVPLEGQPHMAVGAMPKDSFTKAIKEIFNINPPLIIKP
ncbi:MAG: thioredoxin [Bacteroidales bacterium]|nr:thioredoxin [Bacteroidales bacterium]